MKRCIESEPELFKRLKELNERARVHYSAMLPHGEIIRYIGEHYADREMCLSFLAQKFSLSEAYISRIIKTNTGVTYAEYVETMRMKKAVELLITTRLRIDEVASAVGYESNTFFKAFKRHYNITPSAYRESIDEKTGSEM